MIGFICHRGPDETGIYLDDHVGLGHARLSIIDLSTGGQPIHNEDEASGLSITAKFSTTRT
jgi:asparagine synthase (glutamine-hydrolysing)